MASGSDLDLATAGMLAEAKKHSGPKTKPPKVVKRIEHERASDGTHVFTHHHTHPEHHPAETHHYKPSKTEPRKHDDDAVDHFIQHAIPPNQGEGEPAAPGAQAEPAEPAGAPEAAEPGGEA